ncbi:MAG: NAD+ synthase, partial [Desulfobulbaceae bacterium]|nr:NAD+ synthase [Candidatus Desulfatifera sulfidica]
DQALQSLAADIPAGLAVLLGCVEQRSGARGRRLYNSALLLRDGTIQYRVRKQLLPSYDVFDERRYFEPGPPAQLLQLGGLTLAVTICEDIWQTEIGHYGIDPVKDLFDLAEERGMRIDAVLNISASPFQRAKEQVRLGLFRDICHSHQVPLLFVNQVGGQDSLLFGGRSLLMNRRGEITARSLEFAEDLLVVDSESWQGELHSPVDEDPLVAVHDALVMGLADYVRKCGFKSVVLGLSGGIDSALTAALAVRALGPENVLGVALPSPYSSDESLDDARALAENLGCSFEVIPIAPLFAAFRESLAPLFGDRPEDLTEQNLQARIRGNLLMALSNKFGHMLLSTGNKSELAVGYCTLYGDMSGGLGVISDVPKQLVYELARFVNNGQELIPERTITRAPTAELAPDQCDQDDLPSYEILDHILELYLEQGLSVTEIVARGLDETVVRDVVRRIQVNEYKRKQAPMGLKVTSKAFGFGRRYPNVQNYRE